MAVGIVIALLTQGRSLSIRWAGRGAPLIGGINVRLFDYHAMTKDLHAARVSRSTALLANSLPCPP
jgi:hypothetical protein